MEPKFFETQEAFRDWLEAHHQSEAELWVGYFKKATKIPSITWPESVSEALCYGWIDGIRKSIDDKRYRVRFTPRKPKSIWSAANLNQVAELIKENRMKPMGIAAFERREAAKSEIYVYEQKNVQFDKEYEVEIQNNPEAWSFFDQLAPSYKRQSIWWVMSAKREETRLKRLVVLIESSADGLKIPQCVSVRNR